MKKIAIIGAGLAGLTAAHFLRQKADITIFEKSRGVSGRLSTRRAEPYHFDHGAQYFSARTDQFKDFIQPLIHSGVIEPWNARFVDISNREISSVKSGDDHDSYYIGVPGMNAIGKYLSRDLDVRIGGCVDSILRMRIHGCFWTNTIRNLAGSTGSLLRRRQIRLLKFYRHVFRSCKVLKTS